MNAVHRAFFPPEHRERAGLELQKRVIYIIDLNLLMLLFFSSASLMQWIVASKLTFFLIVISLNSLLVASLFLIRAGRYVPASCLTLFNIMVNINAVMYGMPYLHFIEIYHSLTYMAGIMTVSVLISIRRAQIIAVGALNLLSLSAGTFFRILPHTGGVFPQELLSSYIAGNIGLVTLTVICVFIHSFSRDLVTVAETERNENRRKYEKLQTLIFSSKRGLEMGDRLVESSKRSLESSDDILGATVIVQEKLSGLNRELDTFRTAVAQIAEKSAELRRIVQKQGTDVAESSAAMEQIRANLENMDRASNEKQKSLKGLVESFSGRRKEAAVSMESIDRIIAASDRLIGVVDVIGELSGKTNLISMNAAIIAARAGESGRSFSVVAAEIKKLSEQTKTQTELITRTLEENRVTAAEARAVSERFEDMFARTEQEISGFAGAIDEILRGLHEMSTAVRQIAEAGRSLAEKADQSGHAASSLEDQVEAENRAISLIETLSGGICSNMGEVVRKVESIRTTLQSVDEAGVQNGKEIGALFAGIRQIADGEST